MHSSIVKVKKMGRWSLHPGDAKSRRERLRPWDKVIEKVLPQTEEEEDFFNPNAGAVDPNPFPEVLMTQDEAEQVASDAVVTEPEPEIEVVPESEPEVEVALEPEVIDTSYESMTVTQLQDILRERGLTVSGIKAELIARLEADDAGPTEEVAPSESVEVPSEEAASSDESAQEGEVSESGGNNDQADN